eukprot:CAMPEP_0171316584 /NCGR_PEP_ID=MMETSP0816-20121228/74085_1 /TAXON_ID=420281 /ORGANISM="Proboscia inermis, Strain CCAP1064/1" /LENGTH=51 /DNA_ID=CAMNT_0011808783 /DNA_START=103 /DNA_END=258 /DNA_ORIENTATION=+
MTILRLYLFVAYLQKEEINILAAIMEGIQMSFKALMKWLGYVKKAMIEWEG